MSLPPDETVLPGARCEVFTFKEGLLSAVAHDLRFEVEAFRLIRRGDALSARVAPSSLQLIAAQQDGVDQPKLLSASDRRKIQKNVQDILGRRDLSFEGTLRRVGPPSTTGEILAARQAEPPADQEAELEGDLTICGRTRPLTLLAHASGGTWRGQFLIHQPDFGIKPFSAMLGALKIQADIKVLISCPL